MRMRTVSIIVAASLVIPAAASAHIGVAPALVRAGATSRLSFDVPNEREGRAMTAFSLRVPPGARVVSAEPSPGWTPHASATEAVWSGSLAPGRRVALALALEAPDEPGALDLKAEQRYADGGSVRWTVRVVVGPAATASPPMRLGRALATGVVGLAAIAAGLALVRRRRSLSES